MPEDAVKPDEVSAGSAEAFPLDKLRIVSVEGREIGILRRSDGRVHAMRNWCPHKGAELCKGRVTGTMLPGEPGTLTYAMDGEVIRCPWHGFEFEIETGKRIFSDSRMRLRTYPARIANGEIRIDMGARSSKESEA